MLIRTFFDKVELHRDDKFVSLRFREPFRVISTSSAHGGLVEHLDAVYNHQGCEPSGAHSADVHAAYRNPALYDAMLLAEHGLAGAAAAGLGTAANMNNLAIVEERFRDLCVVALATGGVEGNAARAGDPAGLYEFDGRYEPAGAAEPHGTINVMIAVNVPMTEGALVRAVMTATEAKAAVLQELSVPSRQSQKIATGTGTDQIAVAAPTQGCRPLVGAGHHTTLGELIGRTVHGAIAETLRRQNGLTPVRQGSCAVQLARFGVTPESLQEAVAARLSEPLAGLMRPVFGVLDRDPPTVAAVIGLAHVHDQTSWGVLPASCWQEMATQHGALIAMAVSGRSDLFASYRTALAGQPQDPTPGGLVGVVATALALGFADKWLRTTERLKRVIEAAD